MHDHSRSKEPLETQPSQWMEQLWADTDFKWLNQDLHYMCSVQRLAELLEQEQLIGVADGSFLSPTGTAAFCLAMPCP